MNKSRELFYCLIFCLALNFILAGAAFSSSCLEYNRAAAVKYAQDYWSHYNIPPTGPYNSYTGQGGDCTNFVSQALAAGGFAGRFNKDMCTGFGIPCRWDLILRGKCSDCVDEKGMIVRVDVLVAILQRYFCAEVNVMGKSTIIPSNLKEGDVVVFGYVDADGNVTSERFHAGIIVETDGTFKTTKNIF